MNKIFFVNPTNDLIVTYNQLFDAINDNKSNVSYCKYFHTNDTFLIIQNLIIGLLSNKEIVLLDSSFTNEEVRKYVKDEELINTFEKVQISDKINNLNLNDLLRKSKSIISLFTSGTTGEPKLISHDIDTFLRTVKSGKKYVNHIWGFLYNITHMAGLQVLFQALVNMNTIIYLFEGSDYILKNGLSKYQVTHLSATPTFFRMLSTKNSFPKVVRVTLGGEKSDDKLLKKVKHIFPYAKVNNIYASTELGTLFVSKGDVFDIPDVLRDKVRIIDDTIYIHFSLFSVKYQSNIDSEWVSTGDKVQLITDKPITFKFLGRDSDIINIGGYNVNLNEVKEVIEDHPDVQIANILKKENRLIGNVLIAEIQLVEKRLLTEKELINYLKLKIQDYKIPRLVRFVKKISKTRTGKIKKT